MTLPTPQDNYIASLEARRREEARLDTKDRRFSEMRLGLLGAAAVVLWGALGSFGISLWWLTVPALAFAVLMGEHDKVIRARETASRAVRWYQWGLERLQHRWTGSGETGDRFLDDDHPYARDLDVFGTASVFQLTSTAQTASGEETLAAWLRAPSEPDVIRDRQQAVSDLSERPQLREDLYTLGVAARRAVDSAFLVEWATTPPWLAWRWVRIVGAILATALIGTTGGWLSGHLTGWVPVGVGLSNALIGLTVSRSVSRILHTAAAPAHELLVLAAIFARLRAEAYTADRLRVLHAALESEDTEPVLVVRRLDRSIQMHDWQHNMVFAPFGAALVWGPQCAAAVEAWRSTYGASVSRWLETVGEFEALAAFGTYHFEHPEDPFPEVLEPSSPPIYDAEQLAHPLLPSAQAVANDIRLGEAPQLVIVSGSNMSGKTTLLRTVGVNGVLAQAGAPVRARRLRLSPMNIGGTLRVQDSLLAGRSKFYAEILRVKQLVEIGRAPGRLLFLMDELFNGTNSHDRVEGAHGVLQRLIDLGAIGMITTHDLALAEIGERLETRARNVHFDDRLVDGELAFDYRLKDGRSTHGNALALMRAVGLGLDGDTPPRPPRV